MGRRGVLAAAVVALALAGPTADADTPLIDGTPLCGVASPPDGSPSPTPDDGQLRVGSFNVLHSDTEEGDATLEARLPLAAHAVQEANVDVVGLQEVTRNEAHGLVAQRLAEALAARTGDTWEYCWSQSNPHVPLTPEGNPLDDLAARFGNTPDPGDFREGLAILTRFHISETRYRRLLPRSYEALACLDTDPFCRLDAAFDARQVLWAHIETPTSDKLDMFTTHIAHGITPLSDTTKLLQVQQAVGVVDEWATPDPSPDFLVGDFNSDPSTDRHQALVDAGFFDTWAAANTPECTAPGVEGCTGGPAAGEESYTATASRAMSERIDYVWARPPSTCALSPTDVVLVGINPELQPDGRWLWPSDHVGLAATIAC